MNEQNKPSPAISDAMVEALVSDLIDECERAIRQRDGALTDPKTKGPNGETHDTLFGFIVRKHLSAIEPTPSRNDVLEEAAKVAEAEPTRFFNDETGRMFSEVRKQHGENIAAAILALKDKTP